MRRKSNRASFSLGEVAAPDAPLEATASQFGYDGPTVERMRNAFMSPFAAGASPEMVMLAHDRYDMPYRVHPSWPVYHADTITRILTRMGVDWRTP